MAVVPSNTPSVLRSIQRDYTMNRGYSIGYNFAIDKEGLVWELRGFDIKCAANIRRNNETIAILCLVDGSQPMNSKMVASFKALGAEAQRRMDRQLTVVCHCDIGITACPGVGIVAQVKAGKLEPGDTPDPKPPIPTPGDDDVAHYVFTSQTDPPEFNAMFFGTGDAVGRTIELQWSGSGDDPEVQDRIDIMLENFGPPRPLLLAGVKNNRLHPKHKPSDINDSLHSWTDADFAP